MQEKVCRVKVHNDHITKITCATPENAIAELIWNALDADATVVDVLFEKSQLNGVDAIIVKDNGVGFSMEQAYSFFESLGGSWKFLQGKSPAGRFLHGKEGQGRFKAFSLGKWVDWHVNYKSSNSNENILFVITANRDKLNEFLVKEVEKNDAKKGGVVVRISELSKQFKILNSEVALEKLLPIFALYLKNYPHIRITVSGGVIDVSKAIKKTFSIELERIEYEGEEYPFDLEIIEWIDVDVKEIWYCNYGGFPIVKYNKQIRGIGEYSFSAYLKSEFFSVLNKENKLSLGDLNDALQVITEKAIKAIKDYFIQRNLQEGQEQIRNWKSENVYPYKEEAQTPIEVAERQIFDIVAVKLHESLPSQYATDQKGKAFHLRMLRQVIESSPEDLQNIITEVLNLPTKSREELSEILQDISLTGIINASKLVADRLKFITGLEFILFDEEGKKSLKERSQLHRMIAENTWIFGPEFAVSVDDQSLTEVLRKHHEKFDSEIIIDEPVKRVDGTVGIIDLMLSRSIPSPREDEIEHLVIELKAPKVKVGQSECSQIKSYAFSVIDDPRFANLKARWNFWIISNEIDNYTKMELSQENRRNGVLFRKSGEVDVTVWVKTWSQVIKENKHRLEFVREKLNYGVDSKDGIQYLRKVYSQFLKGVVIDGEYLVEPETTICR
jgi:hypothetical protein